MGSFDFEHCGCRQHFACFACRKAFKAGDEFVPDGNAGRRRRAVSCPECAAAMAPMGLLFRTPPKRSVKAWRKLEALARASPDPPFQFPGVRPHERPPEGDHCGAAMVDGRCVYCGFRRRAAGGGSLPPRSDRPK